MSDMVDHKRDTKDECESCNSKYLDPIPVRGEYANKVQFLLSLIGLSVGIGNVWRFPFIAYENGGGTFILVYFLLVFLVGRPVYYLELALGQFSTHGVMGVWTCFPIAKGIGIATIIACLLISIYYNVVLAYSLFYLYYSFSSPLPWSSCSEDWGADLNVCYNRDDPRVKCFTIGSKILKAKAISGPQLQTYADSLSANCSNATQLASEHFYEKFVLDRSESIDHPDGIKGDLALALFVAWLIVYICIVQGVNSTGKVVYITATFPYLILLLLMIFGLTLDGAMDGLEYLFKPEWGKLLDLHVWRRAGEQLFFSLSAGWGCLITISSYNRFDNNINRDCIIVSFVDFFASIMGGIAIFSILGNMAFRAGTTVPEVARKGSGLAFVVYPEAISQFWFPQLWAVLFFLMLILLGIDTQFSIIETFLTVIYDRFPKTRYYKPFITMQTCILGFLLGLPCVTRGGSYVFDMMDTYAGGITVVMICVYELIILMWGYGFKNMKRDIKFMTDYNVHFFLRISWSFISPIFLIIIFVYGLVEMSNLNYPGTNDPYPLWAKILAWLLVVVSLLQAPIWAVVLMIKYKFNWEKLLKPAEAWGPAEFETKKRWKQYCLDYGKPTQPTQPITKETQPL